MAVLKKMYKKKHLALSFLKGESQILEPNFTQDFLIIKHLSGFIPYAKMTYLIPKF